MSFNEALDLDISAALRSIDEVGAQLESVTASFAANVLKGLDQLAGVDLELGIDATELATAIRRAIATASPILDVDVNTAGLASEVERATETAEPTITPELDTRQVSEELDRFEGRERTRFADLGHDLGDLLSRGVVLLGIARITASASDLQQSVGGTAAVFRDAADEIDRFAQGAAESVGLSERAAREVTSALGASFQGFGFAADEAADASILLTNVSADLAATLGGGTTEAVDALTAALRGETDPAERYIGGLRATDVAARAVALGLTDAGEEVSNYAKAQATLSIIVERASFAQGQFAREADSAAGSAQISAAKTEDAAAALGDSLLPIRARVSEVVGSIADGFATLPGAVQTAIVVISGVAAVAGPVGRATEALKGLSDAATSAAATGGRVANVLAGGGSGLIGVLGPVGAAAGLAGAAWLAYSDSQRQAAGRVQELTAALQDQNAPISENITRAFSARLSAGLTEGLVAVSVSATEAKEAITGTGAAAERLEIRLKDAGYDEAGAEVLRLRQDFESTAAEMVNTAIASDRFSAATLEAELRAAGLDVTARKVAEALADGAVSTDEFVGAGLDLAPLLEILGVEAPEVADGVGRIGGAAATATGPTTDFASALSEANSQLADLFDIGDSLPVIETELRDALAGAADEAQRLADNQASAQERSDAFIGVVDRSTRAIDDYVQALLDQGVGADEAAFRANLLIDDVFDLGEQFGVTEDQAADLRTQLGLDYPDVVATVRSVGIAEANAALEELQQRMADIRARNEAFISVSGLDPSLFIRPQGSFAAGGFVPGPTGRATPVIAHAGELILNRAQQGAVAAGLGAGPTADDLQRIVGAIERLAGKVGPTFDVTVGRPGDLGAAAREARALAHLGGW